MQKQYHAKDKRVLLKCQHFELQEVLVLKIAYGYSITYQQYQLFLAFSLCSTSLPFSVVSSCQTSWFCMIWVKIAVR